MAYTDMEYLRKGPVKYSSTPRIEQVSVEQTIAKRKMTRFFNEEME